MWLISACRAHLIAAVAPGLAIASFEQLASALE